MTGLPLNRCTGCGHAQFPPGLLCAACHGAEFDTVTASAGTIVTLTSWTTSGQALQFAEVETDVGPTVVALIAGEEATPGANVAFSSTTWPMAHTHTGDEPGKETES
ncbi:Zn-ribbon domain-containing OB-fold protein [Leekyejoonella antrihumi]|uniref:Zn-ribbon domain-containing OB-fold protein n=1 Tax=Leekyejoonella antrihumi TaxID=1660198 RepID=UPI001C96EFD9|nr:zinc ribbon domain-containing protein [Leekyejoonella antrihumi]